MIFYHDKKHFLLIHLIRECDRLLCLNNNIFLLNKKCFLLKERCGTKNEKTLKHQKVCHLEMITNG